MSTIHLAIQGMASPYCKKSIEIILQKIEGIVEANADLRSGTVEVKGYEFDFSQIREEIESIGYIFKGAV